MFTIVYCGGPLDGLEEYQNVVPKAIIYSAGLNSLPLSEAEFAKIDQHSTRTMLYHKYTPKKLTRHYYQYVFDGFA